MTSVRVSDKGQITLPAEIRSRLGIKSGSRMEVAVHDNDVVLTIEGSVMEAYGALSDCAKGDAEDWENVRSTAERQVADEVNDARKR